MCLCAIIFVILLYLSLRYFCNGFVCFMILWLIRINFNPGHNLKGQASLRVWRDWLQASPAETVLHPPPLLLTLSPFFACYSLTRLRSTMCSAFFCLSLLYISVFPFPLSLSLSLFIACCLSFFLSCCLLSLSLLSLSLYLSLLPLQYRTTLLFRF